MYEQAFECTVKLALEFDTVVAADTGFEKRAASLSCAIRIVFCQTSVWRAHCCYKYSGDKTSEILAIKWSTVKLSWLLVVKLE